MAGDDVTSEAGSNVRITSPLPAASAIRAPNVLLLDCLSRAQAPPSAPRHRTATPVSDLLPLPSAEDHRQGCDRQVQVQRAGTGQIFQQASRILKSVRSAHLMASTAARITSIGRQLNQRDTAGEESGSDTHRTEKRKNEKLFSGKKSPQYCASTVHPL